MLSETALNLRSSALSEISKYVDEKTLKLGNEGNKQRFINFLDEILST